jgi:hypothetical protein
MEEGWKTSKVTEKLRREISEFAEAAVTKPIPCISFQGYQQYLEKGSRRESEEEYFEVRKHLAALTLYLQWNQTEAAVTYFNELLWRVANEFSWCLAAHLPYGEERFLPEADQHIDLFAAETVHTLSETLTIHKKIIHTYIYNHVLSQVKRRVLEPFMNKTWGWETTINNWCAVCAGSIGMAALLLAEELDDKDAILHKADKVLVNYLKGFGDDGATEEGIGYWVYGFGYYIYYLELRLRKDKTFTLDKETIDKLKKISSFPACVQIKGSEFLPFSDVSAGILIPTGLVSYLKTHFGLTPPSCEEITPFDFDHGYRFAHLSRNLWWTKEEVITKEEISHTSYFQNLQWLIQKKSDYFFAVKGGHNLEQHNHNDVGSFVLALGGELILTDLGAGPYTAEYFGAKRYQHAHTRSYWHNVPFIEKREQMPVPGDCKAADVVTDSAAAGITFEYSAVYNIKDLISLRRSFHNNLEEKKLIITDSFQGVKPLNFEEGFVSTMKPVLYEDGILSWSGKFGTVTLLVSEKLYCAKVEEELLADHSGRPFTAYRTALELKQPTKEEEITLIFTYKIHGCS